MAPPASTTPAAGTYQTFYGFRKNPFDDAEAPTASIFESQSLQATLDAVVQAIRSNAALIVVTGEAGVGKTQFYRWFLEGVTTGASLSAYPEPPSGPDALLTRLAADLGDASSTFPAPRDPGRPAQLARCRERLEHLAAEDGAALAVIDGAHALGPDVFDDVCELVAYGTRDANHLQFVLIGRPELEALLGRPAAARFQQYEIKRCQVRPLGADEVAGYIDQRLAAARAGVTPRPDDVRPPGGKEGASSGPGAVPEEVRFTAQAIGKLALLSGGTPALLNALCDRALHVGHTRRRRSIGSREVLAAARDLQIPVPLGVRFAGIGTVAGWRRRAAGRSGAPGRGSRPLAGGAFRKDARS